MVLRPLFAVSACVACGSIARADVTLQDGTFTNSNWVLEVVQIGSQTGIATAGQSPTGNPGTARNVSHTLGNLPGDQITTLSRYGTTQATRYDPVTQGAIASVDWTIDARFVGGSTAGGGQAIMLGLKQGVIIYYADYDLTGFSGAWNTFSATGLTSTSFSRIDGAAGTPDFSSSGAPIRFGFITSNGTSFGTYSTSVDYDNFSVNIVQVPASGAIALAGVGLLGAARRRR